jgi:hypothetical protein
MLSFSFSFSLFLHTHTHTHTHSLSLFLSSNPVVTAATHVASTHSCASSIRTSSRSARSPRGQLLRRLGSSRRSPTRVFQLDLQSPYRPIVRGHVWIVHAGLLLSRHGLVGRDVAVFRRPLLPHRLLHPQRIPVPTRLLLPQHGHVLHHRHWRRRLVIVDVPDAHRLLQCDGGIGRHAIHL